MCAADAADAVETAERPYLHARSQGGHEELVVCGFNVCKLAFVVFGIAALVVVCLLDFLKVGVTGYAQRL